MENASKALIIAGAILLAILLISLGIFIFTGAQDTAKKAGGLESQEAATFNASILKYEGKNKTTSDIRSLKNEIISANKKLKDIGKTTQITIGTGAATAYNTSTLDESKRYTIKVDFGTDGYVNKVIITQQ